jgi:hypothetical protein
MAHTISDRRRQARLAEMAPELIRAQREQAAAEIAHAHELVAAWNERAKLGRPTTYYPTVASAIVARTPILEVLCPACRTIGAVDLRLLDLHPAAAISALIPRLSCRRCCPNPPFAVLVGLKPGAPSWRDLAWQQRLRSSI